MFLSDAFAQETAPIEATTATTEQLPAAPYELTQEKQFTDTLIFLGLLFFIFYFVLIRPQQKKFKAHQEVLKTLQKGDEVITGGGIIGKIHAFDGDDVVIVELTNDVRVKVARASISDKYLKPSRPAKGSSKNTANDN